MSASSSAVKSTTGTGAEGEGGGVLKNIRDKTLGWRGAYERHTSGHFPVLSKTRDEYQTQNHYYFLLHHVVQELVLADSRNHRPQRHCPHPPHPEQGQGGQEGQEGREGRDPELPPWGSPVLRLWPGGAGDVPLVPLVRYTGGLKRGAEKARDVVRVRVIFCFDGGRAM